MPVEVKIERQEWNTVRVQAAGGDVTTKNQVTLTEELKATLQVEGAKGAGKALTQFQFTPKKGGTYFLTATSKDAKGLNVLTRLPFYVLGGDGYPWSWEDGENITLQPDKTTAKPGEEVTIVVKSPISGTALVTVERNRVHRQFLAPITPENPVVKVPITEEDSPNAFISVIVIRGAADSPQPDKMPEYKLGYCEITRDFELEEAHCRGETDPAHGAPRRGTHRERHGEGQRGQRGRRQRGHALRRG